MKHKTCNLKLKTWERESQAQNRGLKNWKSLRAKMMIWRKRPKPRSDKPRLTLKMFRSKCRKLLKASRRSSMSWRTWKTSAFRILIFLVNLLICQRQAELHYHFFSDQKLNATDAELERAKLTERIDSLRTLRNHQSSDMKAYTSEIEHLENEVKNIKQISSALPSGCFKRTRLEP